jgi:hypothetical protein
MSMFAMGYTRPSPLTHFVLVWRNYLNMIGIHTVTPKTKVIRLHTLWDGDAK